MFCHKIFKKIDKKIAALAHNQTVSQRPDYKALRKDLRP
jgi:hypothetical protein